MPAMPMQPQTPSAVSAVEPTLHEHAIEAERALEQLATGLSQSGAEADIVQTFTQMAEVARQLVVSLGRGQEQTADEALPAPVEPRTIEGAARDTQAAMVAAA